MVVKVELDGLRLIDDKNCKIFVCPMLFFRHKDRVVVYLYGYNQGSKKYEGMILGLALNSPFFDKKSEKWSILLEKKVPEEVKQEINPILEGIGYGVYHAKPESIIWMRGIPFKDDLILCPIGCLPYKDKIVLYWTGYADIYVLREENYVAHAVGYRIVPITFDAEKKIWIGLVNEKIPDQEAKELHAIFDVILNK